MYLRLILIAWIAASACTEIPNTQVVGEIVSADPAGQQFVLVDEMSNRWRIGLLPGYRIATEYEIELGFADLRAGSTVRVWGYRTAPESLSVYLTTFLIDPPLVLEGPEPGATLAGWSIPVSGRARVPDSATRYRLVAGRQRHVSGETPVGRYRPRAEDVLANGVAAVELARGTLHVEGAISGAHGMFGSRLTLDSTDVRLADAGAIALEISARTIRGARDTFSVVRALRLPRIVRQPAATDSLPPDTVATPKAAPG